MQYLLIVGGDEDDVHRVHVTRPRSRGSPGERLIDSVHLAGDREVAAGAVALEHHGEVAADLLGGHRRVDIGQADVKAGCAPADRGRGVREGVRRVARGGEVGRLRRHVAESHQTEEIRVRAVDGGHDRRLRGAGGRRAGR